MLRPLPFTRRTTACLIASALAVACGDRPAPAAEREAPSTSALSPSPSTPAPARSPASARSPAPPAAPDPARADAAPPLAAPAPVTAAPDARGIVRLRSDDRMRFNATRIEVEAGRTVAIELENAGSQPRDAMGHNLVVLRPGSDVTALAAKALDARATGYVPAGAPEVLAHTRLLGPGERELLRFDVPGPGTYPFLCSFPGHVGIMNGKLVVR